MLVNCVTVNALGICIHGITQSSGTGWEAVQKELAQRRYLGYCRFVGSCRTYPGIWRCSEDQLRLGHNLSQVDRRTRCTYKVYFPVSSPLPSIFSGSSHEQFSMCITINIVSLHLPPSQSPIPWEYIQSLSATCIMAAPQLCSPPQQPALSRNMGQSRWAVLAWQSWATELDSMRGASTAPPS